jgi:hypothetical protein
MGIGEGPLMHMAIKINRKHRSGFLLNNRQALFHTMRLVHQRFVLRWNLLVGDVAEHGVATLHHRRSQSLVVLLRAR